MPPASPISEAAARAIAERNWIRLDDGRVQYRNDVRVRARLILNPSEEQVIEFIAAIKCPVLLITGTKGPPLFFVRLLPLRGALMAIIP